MPTAITIRIAVSSNMFLMLAKLGKVSGWAKVKKANRTTSTPNISSGELESTALFESFRSWAILAASSAVTVEGADTSILLMSLGTESNVFCSVVLLGVRVQRGLVEGGRHALAPSSAPVIAPTSISTSTSLLRYSATLLPSRNTCTRSDTSQHLRHVVADQHDGHTLICHPCG